MRISLIHGEDTAKAYNRFRELVDASKAKDFEIIQINDLKDVVSQSLFDNKIVFTLEKPDKVKLNGWKWLKENASKYNSNLLIYYDGVLPAGALKTLPENAKIE